MSDTATLRQRIADELNRAPSQIIGAGSLSFGQIVNREINAALKHYESTRTWFMEFKDWAVATTVDGERYYSLTADFLRFDSLKLVYNVQSWINLIPKTWGEIEEEDRTIANSTGVPTNYVGYANTLRLYPVPNSAYSLVGSGVRRPLLTSLTGSFTATNTFTPTSTASHNNRRGGWYEHGADLIRARAKASIEINYLRKQQAIDEMRLLYAKGETYLSIPERVAYVALADETGETASDRAHASLQGMNKNIVFGAWLPDVPDFGNPGATNILNAIPEGDYGYRPMPSLVNYSNALDNRAQGSYAARESGGDVRIYAGDADKLYRMSDTSFATAHTYATGTSATELVRFAQFGSVLLSTNFADEVQAVTVGGASFSAAFTSTLKPNARYIMALRNFVVVGNTNDSTDGNVPWRVWWSGFNDYTDMDPAAATQCDYEDLREGGWVQALTGGADYGLIHQERQITRMTYKGGEEIFQFDPVDRLRGTPIPASVIGHGRRVFFISEEGFYVSDGVESYSIGHLQVDKTFWNQFDIGNKHRVSAAIDPENKLVMWGFPGANNSGGTPNLIYIYNWEDRKWSQADVDHEQLAWLATQGYTLDGLDSVGTDIDDSSVFDESFDHPKWSGGVARLAAFGTDKKLAYFSGDPMNATLETTEFGAGYLHSQVDGCEPLVDGAGVSASIASRANLKDAITYSTPVDAYPDGFVPLWNEGQYHRIRVSLSGSWSHAQGIHVNLIAEGER